MWPFFQRQKQPASGFEGISFGKPLPPRHMKFTELINDMGDITDLAEHDIALKFWLPEAAEEALQELSELNGQSMSEALRQFFAQYCYGVYAYQVMVTRVPRIFRDPEPAMFSRGARIPEPVCSSDASEANQEGEPPDIEIHEPEADPKAYRVPELGKNVRPVKVWVASRMRDDLQILADHANLKLSRYAREIVISRLLGHGTLPKRPRMLNAAPLAAAEEWCES